jgi:hypothetical protein
MNTQVFKRILIPAVLFYFVVNNLNAQVRKSTKSSPEVIFNIPPESGPGSGVCQVTLSIKNGYMKAIEICGGHGGPNFEHTTSGGFLFKTKFIPDFMYQESKLRNTRDGNSIPGNYFKISGNKLYLYNEKQEILNDFFCTYGKTDYNNKGKKFELMGEGSCDCIFYPD